MNERKKLHEILDLILDINGIEERQTDITGKKPTAFLHYSGHVNVIEVDIHKSGWSRYEDPEISLRAKLSDESCMLDSLIDYLQDFKEEVGNVL